MIRLHSQPAMLAAHCPCCALSCPLALPACLGFVSACMLAATLAALPEHHHHRCLPHMANPLALASPGSLACSLASSRPLQHVKLHFQAAGTPYWQQVNSRRRRRPVSVAAAAAQAGSPCPAEDESLPGAWEEALTDLLSNEGGWDPGSPQLQACVHRGSALVSWLAGREGVGLPLALQLAMAQCRLEAAHDSSRSHITTTSSSSSSSNTSSSAGSSSGGCSGLLATKFELFRRLTSAEPGWAAALARALADCPDAAALPLADTQAALRFAAAQLQRASRRRHAQLAAPYSLPRLFLLHPGIGGALLAQHPAVFEAGAAPWLRTQLGWGDAQLADAALTDSFDQLCRFDVATAQEALDWLCSEAGLSLQQAARLLAPPGLRLLVSASAQQAAERRRIEQQAQAWGVGLGLATAVVLSQPPLSASGADLTGRLLTMLRDTVGLSEGQLVEFALAGGLDGGPARSEAALARATARLKQLLLVHGTWHAVAAALAEQPEQLCMSWQGLGSLLEAPQQRAAWQAVAAMEAAAAAAEDG
ncbi:hypothetical protein ABPG75_005079 [Micractinium tetrahymenae]